ncbi:MAG: hypothetical protein AB1664_19100 [Thermodesulfobacteriota bacterium]
MKLRLDCDYRTLDRRAAREWIFKRRSFCRMGVITGSTARHARGHGSDFGLRERRGLPRQELSIKQYEMVPQAEGK